MSTLLDQIWQFVLGNGAQFTGLLFSLLGAFIFYLLRVRPKLVFGRAHASLHLLNLADKTAEPPQPDNLLEVYNEQFFVLNEGRRAAKDVSVVLSHFPRNVSINPPQKVSYENVESGKCLVNIPYIGAKELITLDCIYLNQRAAFIASVRCDESVGRMVDFFTVRRFPSIVYWAAWALIILGSAYLLQFALQYIGGAPL
ncbi:hypothetical protein [Defluviimonas sp. WL0075]|uniref:DUF3592 domain-containing protein n=1 Tax=Albidovulum sediminicola TaxID=2984331 RepID=A0ABT2YWC5_9RHOB|nr:hypothetical protein [Defluviimonas sp. WL0075]MCV2863172.1 hypothetical protein [Defluviimonas sp. WL0075]